MLVVMMPMWEDVVESTYELWKVLAGNMLMGRARWMAEEVGLALR